jgi:hypothetical protein
MQVYSIVSLFLNRILSLGNPILRLPGIPFNVVKETGNHQVLDTTHGANKNEINVLKLILCDS